MAFNSDERSRLKIITLELIPLKRKGDFLGSSGMGYNIHLSGAGCGGKFGVFGSFRLIEVAVFCRLRFILDKTDE